MIRGRIIFQKPQIRYMPYKWLVGELGKSYTKLVNAVNYVEFLCYATNEYVIQSNNYNISIVYGSNGQIRSKSGRIFALSSGVKSLSVPQEILFRIDFTDMEVYANGEVFGHITSSNEIHYRITWLNGSASAKYAGSNKYGAINIDGRIFTPVQLLAPIPPSLDANGIRREKGECGFLDSVSGLFYGNVGSGAFTVSDN